MVTEIASLVLLALIALGQGGTWAAVAGLKVSFTGLEKTVEKHAQILERLQMERNDDVARRT